MTSLLLLSCSRAPAGPAPFKQALAAASSNPSAPVSRPPQARRESIAADTANTSPPPPASTAPTAPPAPESVAPVVAFEGGRGAVTSEYGLVVAVERLAARAGAQVLEDGGNAVDAAIATLFALTVTHPSAASLGGGGFALVRAPKTETVALDFVPVAPGALTRAAFDRMIAAGGVGAGSVGVPGVVAGVSALHERFGTVPLAALLAPALRLAKGHVLGYWPAALVEARRKDLAKDAAARRVFLERGHARKAGAPFTQPDLAWSLERLANHGLDDFYRGAVAERLVAALASEGFTSSDFTSYRAVQRAPLAIRYRNVDLVTMSPPSAGGVALLGTLLAAQSNPGAPQPSAADQVHFLLEAERRAQAERRLSVIDPDAWSESELAARRTRWADPAFWLRLPIDRARATASSAVQAQLVDAGLESEHTTHLSVVDANGLVVSLTTTLCASFGSRVVASGTGIVLNNAVATFARNGENQPMPGRRTTSSMAPTLLLDGARTLAVLGTPGGDTIPSTLAQLVRHLVDERAPLDRAVEAPRWHHGFMPDEARYEPAERKQRALLKELELRGHHLRAFPRRVGDANCMVLDGRTAHGYADSREPGVAVAARKPHD